MLGNIGPLKILVVLVFALIIFGPKRLPELGNSLGRGIREVRDALSGEGAGEAKRLESQSTTASAPEEQPEREVISGKRA